MACFVGSHGTPGCTYRKVNKPLVTQVDSARPRFRFAFKPPSFPVAPSQAHSLKSCACSCIFNILPQVSSSTATHVLRTVHTHTHTCTCKNSCILFVLPLFTRLLSALKCWQLPTHTHIHTRMLLLLGLVFGHLVMLCPRDT